MFFLLKKIYKPEPTSSPYLYILFFISFFKKFQVNTNKIQDNPKCLIISIFLFIRKQTEIWLFELFALMVHFIDNV